jgi:aminopeptidase
MRDPRIEQYARILVDTCVGVQPGWQVIVLGGPMARSLVDEVARQIAQRGAYALVRVNLTGNLPWVLEAPDELIDTLAPIEAYAFEQADGLIAIDAPENTHEIVAIPPERLSRLQASVRPAIERVLTNDLKWWAASTRARLLLRTLACRSGTTRTSSTAPACSTGTQSVSG